MSAILSKNNKFFILCSFFISFFIYIGSYKIAGHTLTIFLLLSILYVLVRRTNVALIISWIIGFSPFIILLRQYIISYSGFTLLLILITLFILAFRPNTLRHTYLSKNLLMVYAFFLIFILIGLLEGAKYIYFLKYIELIFGLMLFGLIFFYDKLKINAFKNLIIATIFMWIVLMKDIGNRFSLETIDGFSIGGDPSSLAIFIIFSMILVFFDQGKQINLENNFKLRNIIFSVLIILLLVSTSRTNMSVFLILMLLYSLKNFKGFVKYIFVGLPILILLYSFLDVQYTNQIDKFFVDKLFNNERNINQISTGRYDQWAVSLHYIFNEKFFQVLFGYGPGQRDFLHKYSLEYQSVIQLYEAGKAFVLHSFYLNVLIEYGLLAFIVFLFYVIRVFLNNIRLFIRNDETPFYFTITYLITIFGNSGLSISGSLMLIFILKPYFATIQFKEG